MNKKATKIIRDHFCKPVDLTSRESMIDFLSKHYRQYMGSRSHQSTYANKIKIHTIPFPVKIEKSNNFWAMLEIGSWNGRMSWLMQEWDRVHDYHWQVGTTGRSGGYLLLYQGVNEPDNFTKTICDTCGIRTGYPDGKCRKSECPGILEPAESPRKISCYSGRGTDDETDFSEWDEFALNQRVELVQSFDNLAADIAIEYARFCEQYKIKEIEVDVPQIRKILVEK